MKCRFLSLIGLIGLILLSCHEEKETISPDPRWFYPFKAQVTGVATYNPDMAKEGIDYYRLEVEEIILDSSTSEYVKNIIDSVLNLPTEGPAIINFSYFKEAGWPDPTTVNKFNLDLFWHIGYGKEFDMYWNGKSYPYIHENVRVCGTEVSEDPNAVILPMSRAGSTGKKFLNLYVHVVRSTTGGEYDAKQVGLETVEYLNNYFKSSEIEFNLLGSDNLDILTNDWEKVLVTGDDAAIKKIYDVNSKENAINAYILSDVKFAKIGGKAESVCSNKFIIDWFGSSNISATSLTHEISHCMGLYHTHHGTYSGDGDGIPELVDGSNSSIAGDYVVDTPADPNKWSNYSYSGGNLSDSKGNLYNPDPNNLMCYSGIGNKLTPLQIERIHGKIGTNNILKKTIVQRTLVPNFHFYNSASVTVTGLYPGDIVNWSLSRESHPQSDDGNINVVSSTYSGPNLSISSTMSEYFDICATITSSNGVVTKLYSKATSNQPSPYTGTLGWSTSHNQYGATYNQQWGQTLNCSADFTLYLDYTDKAGNVLNSLDYTCVTATKRVLKGNKMNLTKSDCSDGFLKIRMNDAYGVSTNYFTIPVAISGGYYALDFQENGDLKVKYKSDLKQVADVSMTKRKIKECTVFTLKNQQRMKLSDKTDDFLVQTSRLPKGEYVLVIQDEEGEHRIPFGL